MAFESKKNELYIGNLSKDVTQEDIEGVFQKYGKIVRCDMKNKGYGPVYAFIEFDDERDAEDAINAEDGKDMNGASMIVKYSKGKDSQGGGRRGGGGGYGGDRGFGGGRSGGRGGGRGGYGGGFGDRGGDRGGGRGPLKCYECGGEGHFARDCRNRRDGAPGGGGGGGGGFRGGNFRRGGGGGGGDRYGGGPPRRDRSGDRDRSRERFRNDD